MTLLTVVWVGTYPVLHRVALPEVANESLRCFNALGLPLRSLEGLEIAAFLLLFLTLGMVIGGLGRGLDSSPGSFAWVRG